MAAPFLIVALAGCGTSKAKTEATAHARPIHVETAMVKERAMPSSLVLAGTLKANQESDLAANASGQVQKTMVERGSYVSKGQAVAQLDVRTASLSTSEAEANAESARTQGASAQAECARYELLFQRGAVSQQDYDRQTTSCKTAVNTSAAAETRAQLAKQTLSNGTVRAPLSGLVSERFVSVGEYVMPSTRVAHIVDIDPLRLELTIPEQNMAAVKEGLQVDFQVAAFPDRIFTGVVHYIGPAVREATRDLVFEAIVPNKDKVLRPGLFATAKLEAGTVTSPVVPKEALRQDGDTTRAYVVVDRHIEERIVQTGPEREGVVAIVRGVGAGETVVVHPATEISDGVEVE